MAKILSIMIITIIMTSCSKAVTRENSSLSEFNNHQISKEIKSRLIPLLNKGEIKKYALVYKSTNNRFLNFGVEKVETMLKDENAIELSKKYRAGISLPSDKEIQNDIKKLLTSKEHWMIVFSIEDSPYGEIFKINAYAPSVISLRIVRILDIKL